MGNWTKATAKWVSVFLVVAMLGVGCASSDVEEETSEPVPLSSDLDPLPSQSPDPLAPTTESGMTEEVAPAPTPAPVKKVEEVPPPPPPKKAVKKPVKAKTKAKASSKANAKAKGKAKGKAKAKKPTKKKTTQEY